MGNRLVWIVGVMTISVLTLVAILAGDATSLDPAEQPAEAVRAILSSQQAAWNRGDIPAFLEGYCNSPELTFAGSEGIVRGYEGLLQRYRKSYPDRSAMGELDFSGLEIRALGPDAALVLGHWHLRRVGGDMGGVFTLVFRRFPEGWRIIHDHTSAQKWTP
jgi:ketosteroid isomerase-like protein